MGDYDRILDRHGNRQFQHTAPEGFSSAGGVQGQRASVTGLRPLRAYAQIQIRLGIKVPLEKPLYATGRKRYPAAALPGASMYLTAQPLPTELAHAENTAWHCRCTRQPPPGAFGVGYEVACKHGPGPWPTVDALRAAHPADSVLTHDGETHIFYAQREIPESETGPGEVVIFTIDGALL